MAGISDKWPSLRNMTRNLQRSLSRKYLERKYGAHRGIFSDRLAIIEAKIDRLEAASHGSSTYLGNNRLLVKIIVEGRKIAYIVEADDRLLTPWFAVAGGYETELTNYYVRELRTDSHCLDVGSNFGYFTCLMSRFCPNGKVIGIEPDDMVFALARDNVHINGFGGIASIVHAAASDVTGEITLYRRHTRSGNTSMVNVGTALTEFLGEVPATPFSVASIRLDELLDRFDQRVDFMKIDVEGAEPLALAGAHELIRTNPQLSIMMEWSPGQIQAAGFDLSEFLASLAALGLRPYDLAPRGLKSLSFDQLQNAPYRAGVVLKRAA